MEMRYCEKCGDTVVLSEPQEALGPTEHFLCFQCEARENKTARPKPRGAAPSGKDTLNLYSTSTVEIMRKRLREATGAKAGEIREPPASQASVTPERRSGQRGTDPVSKKLRFRCLKCHARLEVRPVKMTSRLVCPKCKTDLFINQDGLISGSPPKGLVKSAVRIRKATGVGVDPPASRGSQDASADRRPDSEERQQALSALGLRRTAQKEGQVSPLFFEARTIVVDPTRGAGAPGPAPPAPHPGPAALIALVAPPGAGVTAPPPVLPFVAAPAAPAAQVVPAPPAPPLLPLVMAPAGEAPPAAKGLLAPPEWQALPALPAPWAPPPPPAAAAPVAPPAAAPTAPPAAPAHPVAMVAPVALVALAPRPLPAAPGTAVPPALPLMVAPAVAGGPAAAAPLPDEPGLEAPAPAAAPVSPPVKKPKQSSSKRSLVRVAVYLPPRLIEKAQDTGRPISRLIRETLEEKLARKSRSARPPTPEIPPEPSERAPKD